MLGPSGFFLSAEPEDTPVFSKGLELIHSSENGFNELYRGSKEGRFFVYKALKPEYRGNVLYEKLLRKDFTIGFSLSHSNICQYYAMLNHPEIGHCIVMEWIDGCTLQKLIEKGGISKSLARKMICETCDALEYIHQKQIIHRDLKPENIMVTYNGNNVKVIDFGLSDTDSYNTFKAPAGTRAYASPELIAGENIDSRSDIWSLGVIIKETGTGFNHIAKHCLQRDRSKRYDSASTVKKAILGEDARKSKVATAVLIGIIGLGIAGMSATGVFSQKTKETSPVYVQETLHHTDTVPVMKPVIEELAPEDNAVEKAVTEKPAGTVPESKEELDATSLDNLFNQAAEQIL